MLFLFEKRYINIQQSHPPLAGAFTPGCQLCVRFEVPCVKP